MKYLLLFIVFLIVGCPPVIDNGDNNDTDTTVTDSIPVDTTITDTVITDTTITDSTITDTTETDTTSIDTTDTTDTAITDTSTVKEIKNKYETALNKEKKRSYFQLYFSCPVCSAKNYTDFNIKFEDGYQKFDRKCLKCLSEFKIKRKKNFYECKPK